MKIISVPTILVMVVLRTQNRHSVRHILLQMCWSTILMDNVFDVIVYVQLNYPSMCVTNYSIRQTVVVLIVCFYETCYNLCHD